jgi:hypothetical protein
MDAAAVLRQSNLAAVVVERAAAFLPRGWIALASDAFLDVYHATAGLARGIAIDLGTMPPPISLSHYTDARAIEEGLIGSWLPRLFADSAAALFLGPGFAFGLQSALGRDVSEERALSSAIDGRGDPPLHVRMFVACRALAHAGYRDEAASYWKGWNDRLGDPKEIKISDLDGRHTTLSANSLLNAASRVVDYVVGEPLAPLGGYPLSAVPTFLCDAARMERISELVPHLIAGTPKNAPPRIVLGAALLAVAASPTAERRIQETAFKSLVGKGIEEYEVPAVGAKAPLALFERARSRESLLSAVALGAALAPRKHARYR